MYAKEVAALHVLLQVLTQWYCVWNVCHVHPEVVSRRIAIGGTFENFGEVARKDVRDSARKEKNLVT
jgi:hypothetical protein